MRATHLKLADPEQIDDVLGLGDVERPTPTRCPSAQRNVDRVGADFVAYLERVQSTVETAGSAEVRLWASICANEPIGGKKERRRAPSTIVQQISGLNGWYDDRGLVSPARTPEVSEFLAKLLRHRRQPPRRKKTLKHHEARAIMLALDPSIDEELWAKAVFGFAWCSTAMPGQIFAILAKDVICEERGIVVKGPGLSGRERVWKIAFGPDPKSCAATAVIDWIERSAPKPDDSVFAVFFRKDGIERGLSPRPPDQVRRARKIAISKVRLDPEDYDHQSIRRGYVVTALSMGQSLRQVKGRTGHVYVSNIVGLISGEAIWTKEKSLI